MTLWVGGLGGRYQQTLNGSLSAVSKPNFASKYSLKSIFRDLQVLHTFAPLRIQKFRKILTSFFANFADFFINFAVLVVKFIDFYADFDEN